MRTLKALAALALAALTLAGPAIAQTPPASAPGPTAPSSPPRLTADDVGPWLDGLVPLAIKRGQIAGAEVVIVKDGQVLVEKGYGFADTARRIPVDPRATLFRPGSVTKLFTWTAVMQLVEQGRINLDSDINTYLDFRIPERDGKPVTLRQLMTHTAGFEEAIKGLIVTTPQAISLARNLKAWTPKRIYAPGTTPAYSNYGAALAGYIVQRVSGEPYEQYVAHHILQPLGMAHTTYAQPPPADLLAHMSRGYQTAAGPPQPFEFVTLTPAGALSATGDDMARFMIAHLQDGQFGDARILKPETARLMHTHRTALMAPLNGIELGFFDEDVNGHRVIAHGGDSTLFHSELLLFIDDGVGVYVAQNSNGRGLSLRDELLEAFADRYFPAAAVDGSVDPKLAAEHARMLAGRYISSRVSQSNFLAVTNLLNQSVATANADGTVSISTFQDAGAPRRYREIAPFVWRDVNGHDRLGAKVKDGRVVRFSLDPFSGIMVWDRAPGYLSGDWLMPLVQLSLWIVVLTLVGWPVLAIARRVRRTRASHPAPGAGAVLAVRLSFLLGIGAVVGWLWLISTFGGPGGLDAMVTAGSFLTAVEAITILSALLAVPASLANAVIAWSRPTGWGRRTWSVACLVAAVSLSYFACVGQLMNVNPNF